MDKNNSVYVAGHGGMVGSAIARLLTEEGYTNIITRNREELNLSNQEEVADFFKTIRPEYVILAAAKVGGIQANIKAPAEFLYENLMIQNNVIHHAFLNGVKKLVFLGSSCIYPRECPQPMKEEYLLTGKLEPTNEGYAIAKIAGLKLGEYYRKQYGFPVISLMPCNLYGPNDSFDLQHSHVLSALVKRFTDATVQGASEITLWGTGAARRELMHVTDAAKATLFMLQHYDADQFINIGWGEDISIKDLANLIAEKVGYKGVINWDTTKPDGMMRKCMDVSRMKDMGFSPCISLSEGIDEMIEIYKKSNF
jgi:GDP-L-fucose synthase